jgi:F-type H+-transporting ATPase subunit delta
VPKSASARRYAQAVFQIALERDELDVWIEDLSLLARALENRELAEYLDAPQVPVERKIEVINGSLGDTVGPLALNLISLLASRNIVPVMPDVVDQYQRLLDSHRGIEQAEIVSAVSLDDQQQQRIAELLSEIAGTEVRVTARVDPEIIGGLLARVGDRLIDGSTRTKIQTMRRNLVEQR